VDSLDLSNFTSRISRASVNEWKDQGIGLAIIQLVSGVHLAGDNCQTQILTCLEGGLSVDCYLFPGNDGLPLTTAQRLALVPAEARVAIRQLWVDVEPAYTNPSRPAIDKTLAVCDSWAPWQSSGNYSALWVASKMGWLPWPWPTRKQWLVYVRNDGAPNFGGAFSGTNNHVMTQYHEDVVLAGVSGMDRSLLSDSESLAVTKWLGGPMAITVGQGMQAQMTANGEEPLADHVFYDQEDTDGKVYQVEKCIGSKGGQYVSSNSSGQWVNAGPT
jgi:hypothetical protein